MTDKQYRLKVRRIPMTETVNLVAKPNFPPTDELYLDLIENKDKVRRNAPKPIYVRQPYSEPSGGSGNYSDTEEPQIDDFTLEALERQYDDSKSSRYNGNSSGGEDFEDISGGGGSNSHTESNSRYSTANNNNSSNYSSRSKVPEPSRTQPESYAKSSEFTEQDIPEEDPEIVERREKSEYLVKFMILRRHYPNLDIPEFTEHSDLKSMKLAYEHAFRLTSLDESVEQYRMYIYGSSMALEFASTNWFGFDMSGFAKAQKQNVSKYDRLLFELGEKNYSPEGSRFPVEVRLLFTMLVQAAFFAFAKLQQGSSPTPPPISIPSFGGSFTSNNSRKSPTTTTTKPSRPRMRGPTIKPEDVSREQDSPNDDDNDDNDDKYKHKDD